MDHEDRFALPSHAWLVSGLFGLACTTVMCIRNHSVFSVPIHEDTDYAANSILVNQAVHFHLLVGNYSREGFNHPGPAFLYIQSFGQDLFYSLLHLVPSQYNGQLVAVFFLSGAILAMTALVLIRHTRSWPIALLTVSVVLLLTGNTLAWTSAWMPYLYIAPFLLAAVSGSSVASGALEDTPIFVFAVCLLVHGHIAFVGIMGIYVLVVFATWLLVTRHNGSYRSQFAAHKRPLKLSALILFVFALPIAVNLIFHWPGQLRLYWDYLHSNSHKNAHTLRQVLSYVEQYWPGGHAGRLLLLIAAAVAVVLSLLERNRVRKAFYFGLLGSVVVLSIEVAGYALKGVDQLSFVYTGYFYYSVPPIVLVVLVMQVCDRIREVSKTQMTPGTRHPVATAASVLSVFIVILIVATQGSFYNPYRGDPSLPSMAAAVQRSADQRHKAVAISLGVPGAPSADWPDVVGLLIAASRQGYQPCVANPSWTFMMTATYICTPTESAHRWDITVDTPSVPPPSGTTVIFRDSSTVVYGN